MIGLIACASGPPAVTVARGEGGVEVVADRPMLAVDLVAADGSPVARRSVDRADRVELPIAPPPGAEWRARIGFPGGLVVERTVRGPVLSASVAVEAPIGQGRREVADGDVVEAWVAAGATASVVLTAEVPGPVSVRWADQSWEIPLSTRGEQFRVSIPLDTRREVTILEPAVPVPVPGDPSRQIRFALDPRILDPDEAKAALTMDRAWLPADPSGARDPTLPSDRIRLDRAWFSSTRPAPELPFTWQGVELANHTDAPVDVVIRASVEDPDGNPVRAFRSRARDQEDQPFASVVLRVPANGVAVGAAPLYVDPDEVSAPAMYERHLAVIPLGSTAPLHELRAPLAVDRGDRTAPTGFAAALAISAIGWGMVGLGSRRFLVRTGTADLVTIGLFSGSTFVVGAAFQLVGMAVAAVLGPFAPLLTGFLDDGFRAVLLGTLLGLLPRPGVFAAATTVGFVLRAIALGGVHPADLTYVGAVIAVHELGLWVAGTTRGRSGVGRLALGLGGANAVCVLLGLATSATLYRLYYAGWYVAALAAGPGFLYVVIGCLVAGPIAASLRRVAS